MSKHKTTADNNCILFQASNTLCQIRAKYQLEEQHEKTTRLAENKTATVHNFILLQTSDIETLSVIHWFKQWNHKIKDYKFSDYHLNFVFPNETIEINAFSIPGLPLLKFQITDVHSLIKFQVLKAIPLGFLPLHMYLWKLGQFTM